MMSGTDGEPAARPSANRIVALTLVAFAIALIVHTLIIVVGGRDNPFRLFVTPLIGASVIFFGLAGYSMAGRVRLSVMVGFGTSVDRGGSVEGLGRRLTVVLGAGASYDLMAASEGWAEDQMRPLLTKDIFADRGPFRAILSEDRGAKMLSTEIAVRSKQDENLETILKSLQDSTESLYASRSSDTACTYSICSEPSEHRHVNRGVAAASRPS